MTKRKKTQETQKSTGCEVKKGMPTSVADTEKEENSRKRPRSEDESTETGPKQTEQHGESAPIPSTSTTTTSKKEDNSRPPVFKVNYPFLRSSVKRLKKDTSPPSQPPTTSKKGDKSKDDEHKPAKAVKTERKRWEAWGNQDKTLFFEALNEFGKDFEAIQKYIEQRHKKRGDPGGQVKNKDQVRHLYYRTCHKLFKYITADADQTKTSNELYALINYGELRKKIKGVIDARTGLKLNELVKKGSTTIRYQQRNTRLRTPTCKALKLLKAVDEDENVKPTRLPPRVMLELTPKNNAAWATVQGVAHNPRVRMVVPLRKELGSLLNMLSQKWTPHRIKLLQSMKPAASESVPQVKLEPLEGITVMPYNQLTDCYIHDKGKVSFYPGQVNPPNKLSAKRTKGKSVGKPTAERMVSPVESKVPVERMLSPVETKIPVAERMLSSPVEPDSVLVTQPLEGHDDASVPGDDAGSGNQHRTNDPIFQCHDRLFGEPSTSASGTDGIDLSLPTEFSLIPATEITEDFSIPANQMDYTRIEVSNHRRKTTTTAEREGEEAEMGNGNNVVESNIVVANDEQCLNSPDKGEGSNDAETNFSAEQSKDARLQAGMTMENVGDLSITDVYLMLGMPKVVKFTYDFVHSASSQPNIKLLDRLTQLAKSEFSDMTKPKQMVSVGVATSPTRSGIPPRTAETPPSKSSTAPTHGKSPVSGRGSSTRKALPVTPKSGNAYSNKANAPIIVSPATAAAAVAKACEARGIADRPQPRRDKAVFLAPKPVAPRRITPTPVGGASASGEADKLFKAQLESLQNGVDWQLPKRPQRKQRGRRPLVVQRTLLPRPQSDDVRHMMSMSIVSNSSHASTGQFMPVKLGVDSLGSSPQGSPANRNAVVIASKPNNVVRCHSPLGIPITPNKIVVTSLVASTPKTQGNTAACNSYLNSPVNSPLAPIFISSPASVIEALSPAGMSPGVLSPSGTLSPAGTLSPGTVDMTSVGSPLTQTNNLIATASSLTLTILATDPLLSTPPAAVSSHNSSSLRTPSPMLNKTSNSVATLTISPPNISSLLDISLPSAESASSVGNDTLLDLGFGQPPTSETSPSRMTGSTTPPLTMTSPSTSPFKLSSLGADNQWLNGEVGDISFSSILANLESPEKKDQSATSIGPLCAPASPPRVISLPRQTCASPVHSSIFENSRDSSSITGIIKDVDTHLQCMMNESSVDYVAKFADLAAHIAASAEPPKN